MTLKALLLLPLILVTYSNVGIYYMLVFKLLNTESEVFKV